MASGELEAVQQAMAGMFIQLARIYDVLIVSMDNEEKRDQLLKIHAEGGLLTGSPWLNDETYKEFADEGDQ